MKRMLCMLLVLVSLVSLLPMTAAAEELVFYDREPARARYIETSERESNDSRSSAQFLTQDDNFVSGEVHPYDDPNDYFYIRVNNYCYLNLLGVSGAGGKNSTKFRLYDSSGDLMKSATYEGEENSDDIFTLKYSLKPGKYYIRVSDSKNWVGYYFYFLLESQLTPPTLSGANDAATGKPVISWNSVSGAYKYRISRATSKSGTYTTLAEEYGTSYTDTTAKAGKTYYYKVRALASSSSVHDSRLSSYETRTCDLARPTGVYVTNKASTGKPQVKWDAVSGADEYKVYYATSSSGDFKLLKTVSGTTATHTGAKAGKTYYYKVKAIDENKSAANSAYSSKVSGVCDCAAPELSMSNLASSGKVKISWDDVSGAYAYRIQYSTNGINWSTLATTADTYYKDMSAPAGQSRYYRVMALGDVSGSDSAYSDSKKRTTDLPRPDVDISRTSKGNPKLTWEPVEGAVEYKVYRATSKSGTYKLMKTTEGTSYVNSSSVTEGKTYYYKVKAIASNSAANSAYSTVKSIKAK